MKEGECAYCGQWRELTRDHVPPVCLFGRPRPSNLVTVPCCSTCNRNLSKHDEYFRFAVTAGIDSAKFPNESADSVRAVNNLIRPASRRFARQLLSSYEGNPPRLKLDRDRIDIVLHRIARGLFYHYTGARLPETVSFESRLLPSRNIPAFGRERITHLEGRLNTIGDGIFQHAFEPWADADPFGTLWLMRFYDSRTFFCATASD